jgi:hypothetical protein
MPSASAYCLVTQSPAPVLKRKAIYRELRTRFGWPISHLAYPRPGRQTYPASATGFIIILIRLSISRSPPRPELAPPRPAFSRGSGRRGAEIWLERAGARYRSRRWL